MAKNSFLIVAIAAVVAIGAAAGLNVVATGGSAEGEGGGFLSKLHGLGHHMHGGDHHDQMAEVIEQLNLTPDQLKRLEKVHEIIGGLGSEGPGAMAELHEQLVTQFEQGQVETDGIRRLIDEHVEQIRGMGYAVTDELIALVNGLDATQRETLLAHLKGGQQARQAHGH